jgi:hypothetical protein
VQSYLGVCSIFDLDTECWQVDSINGVANISKNGVWLGRAFSELPEIIYPFVSLPKRGMSAVSLQSHIANLLSDVSIVL